MRVQCVGGGRGKAVGWASHFARLVDGTRGRWRLAGAPGRAGRQRGGRMWKTRNCGQKQRQQKKLK